MALLMGALVKRKRGQLMKILIVGGVAAGTKAAAKLKRLNPAADVTILTKGKDISYAGCGLPYYVGGLIPEKEDLIVNTPAKFTALTGAKVLVEREVTALDAQKKELTAHNLRTGVQENYDYDECVIACGASSIVPFRCRASSPCAPRRTPSSFGNIWSTPEPSARLLPAAASSAWRLRKT